MIRLTVIIPIFNAERFLKKCLDSILNQTLEYTEVLCIDDGSTDGSLELVQQYAERFPQMTLIPQTHKGVGYSRNTGILSAKGEYIAFMDSDDYYPDKNVLYDLWHNAKKHEAIICGGSFSQDHISWIQKDFSGDEEKYQFKSNGWIDYKNYQYDYGFQRFIYKKSFLIENKIFFPDYIRFQDPPFFVKSMVKAKRFYALQRITYCYRAGHQSINWNYTRATAVLNGLLDNLIISQDEHLDALFYLTAKRLLVEYRDIFAYHLSSESETLLELLLSADRILQKNIANIESLESSVQDIIRNALKDNAHESDTELYLRYKQQVDAIYNSWTYKIGSYILYIPKRLRRLIGNKR